MNVKCIKNYVPGFFGFDRRDDFEVGETYSFYTHYTQVYVYNGDKWISLYSKEFQAMFVPVGVAL